MGLLDDAVGTATPGGGLAKPLMIALGALLVGKMLSSQGAAPQPSGAQAGSAGSADGGLLGGLGGLLDKLKGAGHDDAVKSWVGTGQNAPIEPGQLGSALGQKTISDLAQKAGVSEQDLLAQLAKALPGIVDKLTPGGRVPGAQQIADFLRR